MTVPTDTATNNKHALRVPLARLGEWPHPVYGKVTFTEEDYSQTKSNFESNKLGYESFLSFGHLDEEPNSTDSHRKRGRLSFLEDDGEVLWGVYDVPAYVHESVSNGDFEYASGEYIRNLMDKETGRNLGCALSRVALTNSPYLLLPKVEALSQSPGAQHTQVFTMQMSSSTIEGAPSAPQPVTSDPSDTNPARKAQWRKVLLRPLPTETIPPLPPTEASSPEVTPPSPLSPSSPPPPKEDEEEKEEEVVEEEKKGEEEKPEEEVPPPSPPTTPLFSPLGEAERPEGVEVQEQPTDKEEDLTSVTTITTAPATIPPSPEAATQEPVAQNNDGNISPSALIAELRSSLKETISREISDSLAARQAELEEQQKEIAAKKDAEIEALKLQVETMRRDLGNQVEAAQSFTQTIANAQHRQHQEQLLSKGMPPAKINRYIAIKNAVASQQKVVKLSQQGPNGDPIDAIDVALVEALETFILDCVNESGVGVTFGQQGSVNLSENGAGGNSLMTGLQGIVERNKAHAKSLEKATK